MRDFGFNSEKVHLLDGSNPTQRGGIMAFTSLQTRPALLDGWPWFGLEYNLATRLLTGTKLDILRSTTRADGKRACTGVCGVCMGIETVDRNRR